MSQCQAAVQSTVLTAYRPSDIRQCSREAVTVRIVRSGEWSQNVHRIEVCRTHRKSEYAFPFDWNGSIVQRISPQPDSTIDTQWLREEQEARGEVFIASEWGR